MTQWPLSIGFSVLAFWFSQRAHKLRVRATIKSDEEPYDVISAH